MYECIRINETSDREAHFGVLSQALLAFFCAKDGSVCHVKGVPQILALGKKYKIKRSCFFFLNQSKAKQTTKNPEQFPKINVILLPYHV